MAKIFKPRFHLINLGPLPHRTVSAALNIPVSAGLVHCTAGAQIHAYKRHGDDYLAQAIANPTYIGQSPGQRHGGFEMILNVPAGGISVLVAVTLRPSASGIYYVKSVYSVGYDKILRRLRKGFLKRV